MSLRDDIDAAVSDYFLDTNGFAETVTYTPAGGSGASITATLGVQSAREDDGEEGRTLARENTILISLSDVATPAAGDKVTISSVDWNVGDILERGQGWAVLQIHRFEQAEASREGHRRRRV